MTQPVSSASNEGKTPAVPTPWPRDLTDIWAMQPFGSTGWRPFRDIETEEFIKVEEFIDGDHLVIRAELPGVEPDRDIDVSVDDSVLTIAAERQESSRKKLDKGGYRSEFRYGSFIVVPHGSLLSFHSHGVADIASHTPVTEDTVFRIASITKPSPGLL